MSADATTGAGVVAWLAAAAPRDGERRPVPPPASLTAPLAARPELARPVMRLVSVDVSARRNGLASVLARLLEENLARPHKRRQFDAVRAVMAVRATDAGVAVTLAFREGTVALYDGVRGDADVVIEGTAERILELALLTFWHGLPDCIHGAGRVLLRDLAARRVRIHGLLVHPWLVARLARLLSVND